MDGIIGLWKERGMTSHDCVFKMRKILHMKKIGHGGTLDPDVDGVLPICIGKGTKVIEYMQENQKVYEGEITIGFATTTEDASGDIVSEKSVEQPLSEVEIDQAMARMTGTIKQIPPMFSAVKVNGKRLYEYAREGIEVERPERKAAIYSFERTTVPDYNKQEKTQSWRFRVVCGKGTYVRTLAVDTGELLGYPAHMSDLTRTASGGLEKEQCLTLKEIEEKVTADDFSFVLPIELAFDQTFIQFVINEEQYDLVRNGVFFDRSDFKDVEENQPIALFYEHEVVAVYQVHPKKSHLLKPTKILRNDR